MHIQRQQQDIYALVKTISSSNKQRTWSELEQMNVKLG